MISASVPRKARSASTKRSHDWALNNSNNNSGGGISGGDPNLRPPSSSPVRQGHVSTPTAPMSPSSSNASLRKKLKHSVNNNTGPKLKPPKVSSSKPSSSNPEELEIEIAEVLYGLMTQSQGPSSSKKDDAREVNNNRLNTDAKSLNSSPISNSTSNNNPISGPNSTPFSAVAPKRKRPRHVPENSSYGARSSSVSAKPEADQTPKSEISSPNLEKISADNGCEAGGNLVNSQGQQPAEPPVPTAAESAKSDSELKPVAEESREMRDLVAKEDLSSSKEQESPAVRAHDSNSRDSPSIATASSAASTIKANLMVSEMESQKEEKFEIDLMAPPPQVRSSPERQIKIDQKPFLSIVDAELNPVVSKENEDEKGKNGNVKDNSSNSAAEEKKCKKSREEAESNQKIEIMCRDIDLQLDLERPDKDGNAGDDVNGNKSQVQAQKQQMSVKATREEPVTEEPGNWTSSLPLPMTMASWPGGLPPMGYMAPLQGVVSMDGGNVTPAHLQPLFSQPRPKRCATHCHIARNIHCLQQFMKMNPFWPPPAASPSLFGSKPCNLNVMPTADLNISVRGVNNAPDKGQSLASNSNHGGKEKGSQPATTSDSSQRKQQILIQQALPPVAPSNLLGPTFIFPLNQQQAAMAARPAKSPTTGTSSNASSSAATGATSAAAMSFNYPNMAANETQYLAILQNNAYPFPMPPNYRGPPPQAMPLFNGSFYPSQIIHQQLQQQPSNHSPQMPQAHQNASASSNSSSSQKHLQSQQPRPQNSSSQKPQPSQQLQYSHGQYMQSSEDSPSDNRGSRASLNIYGQNFAMPIHPQNFALMTQNSNQMEKKSNQPQQQQGLKAGAESVPPHSFAMSFGPGIDATSMAQTHAMFQSSQEAARQSMQMMAVAAQVAQKKNLRVSEEGKSGNADSSAKEDERKSFAFTRPDMTDSPVTSFQANSVIESSARPSGPSRSSRPMTTNGMGTMNVPNAHVQAQIQQQQMLQLKQQQQQMAANRSKGSATSNGNIYSEHLNSSSMKFQNALSPFPQNLGPSNSTSPIQSPQWRSSSRITPTSQAPSSLGSSTAQTHKNLPQQHSRTQPPMHTQISFGGNQKQSGTSSQGQAPLSSNQAPSSPMMVGSPTTSSISKGTSGSPRTTSSASTNNKPGQGSPFSAQQPKNPSSMPNQKSPSILGNPHTTSSSSGNGAKSQTQQQQTQHKTMQQAQLFFSNPYSQSQSQSPHSANTSASPSGYYMTQRRPDQHQRPPGGQLTSSSGVLSLCPPASMSGTSTNDPATAIAAATCNVKGGGLTSQGMIQSSPFGAQSTGMLLPAGFSYVHPVPAAVQVKPAEQKQPAGNDNLHQWQPEKK